MDFADPATRHPVLACLDGIERALQDVGEMSTLFLDIDQKREALVRLSQLGDQLAGLRLALIAVSQDVADADSARTIAPWLSDRTRTDLAANRSDLTLAQALDRRWQQTGQALTEGAVNLAQARVIVHALDELPVTGAEAVPASVRAECEARLITEARRFTPRELVILGRKILEVIAPDLDEDAEGRKLEEEERRAREKATLFSRRLGDGRTRITATVPDAAADRLRTYLESFTSPRHHSAATEQAEAEHSGLEKLPPYYRRLGHAFCSLLEAFDPHRLPLHGGDATTMMVTIDLETLRRQLGAAAIGVDGRISASEARRLACTAGILPVVLGTNSEILDLGRTSRLFTPAQRKAMAIRDQTCRAEGCTMPATFCEAHHQTKPWSQGGHTDLTDGVLLCPFHHHRAHDTRYLHTRLPNGDTRFHRRT